MRVPLAMVHPKTGYAHAALGLDLVADGKKLIALESVQPRMSYKHRALL